MYCRFSVVLYDVIFCGGFFVGKFILIGYVDSMEVCVYLCCKRNICDIVLMLRDFCYVIMCVSEEFCEEVLVFFFDFYFRFFYVRRDIGS